MDPTAAASGIEKAEGLLSTPPFALDGSGGVAAALASLTGAAWMIYRMVKAVRSEDKELSSTKKRGDVLYDRLVERLENATEERDAAVARADKFMEDARAAQLAEANTRARLEVMSERLEALLEKCDHLERQLQDMTVKLKVISQQQAREQARDSVE